MMVRSHIRVLPLFLLLVLAGCKTQLNANLSETAANEEVAMLLRHNIPAMRQIDPKTNLLTVWVEQSRFADAVDLLQAHGLPRQHYDSIADVFKGNGLVVSPVEEQARMIYALGEELSRTISEIDGVLSARVHIVMQDNDPLRREAPPASASVFVRYQEGSHASDLVPQIKMLVADGIAGLSYDKVSVVLVPVSLPADDAQQAPSLEEVAGVWVYSGSVGMVQLLVAGIAGLFAALLGVLGWLGWRSRKLVLSRVLPGKTMVLR
jgi:type III secretion protein J